VLLATLCEVDRRALPARLIRRCLRKRDNEEDARARIASAARVLASGTDEALGLSVFFFSSSETDLSAEASSSPRRVADFLAPAPAAELLTALLTAPAASITSSVARSALRASALAVCSSKSARFAASAARLESVARRASSARAASSTRLAAAAAAAVSASRALAHSCSACLTLSRAKSSLSCVESFFSSSSDSASSETSAPVTRSTTRPLRSPRTTKAYRFMEYFSKRSRTADRSSSMKLFVVCGCVGLSFERSVGGGRSFRREVII
jgi:hypothetical protein